MKNSGLLALGLTAALAACSGGGSSAPTPGSGLAPLSATKSVAAVAFARTASDEHHDSSSCDQGDGRHGSSVSRNGLDSDHGDGGADTSCCPSNDGRGSRSSARSTSDDGDHHDGDGGGDGHHQPTATPCATATPAAAPSPTPTPTPTPVPRIVANPMSLTIDCSVSGNGVFAVPGNPAGLTAVSGSLGTATVIASTDRTGNLDFLVTGVGSGTTTINLTDTAGAIGTVSVTTLNCGTPAPTPTPSPGR